MPYCEDYPCCGHEAGDCPRINSEGQEIWRCVECYKDLSVNASSSICRSCQIRIWQEEDDTRYYRDDDGE